MKISNDKVLQILSEVADGRPVDQIKPNMTLADLDIDSLQQIELVMAFEEEMAMEINDDDSDRVFGFHSTVGEILAYLDGRG